MQDTAPTADAAKPVQDSPPIRPILAWAVMVGVGLGIWVWGIGFEQRPEGVSEKGWQLLAIFFAAILGLMLRPLPGGAIVLIALTFTILTNTITTEQALGGFADSSVWLVLAAYFLSRAIIKTGLARRIALHFVRLLGKNTLGLSYSLVATDTVLAGMIPSNAARVGGVVLPITRSLAELYRSFPGKSATLLGTFLLLTLYQADVASCAMFLTGQASNPLAAQEARIATNGAVNLHYGSWLLYSCVPAFCSLLIIPYLTYRWTNPTIRHTPEAVEMAERELMAMGPTTLAENVVIMVVAGVCTGWVIDGFQNQGKLVAGIALTAVAFLLITRILTWEDCVSEKAAWDVFIWYGGLVQLGKLLKDTGIPKVFAESVAWELDYLPPVLLFVATLLIYFYAHYAFASITAHIVSMYAAFVGVLIAAGLPPLLAATSFAYITNLSAGLTHYGTTPGPIIFNTQYVPMETWWKVGFRLSLVNLAIWLTIGPAWWKLLGLW